MARLLSPIIISTNVRFSSKADLDSRSLLLGKSMVAITMDLHLFDLTGFIGVLLIVIAYLLLQLDKLPSSSPSYSLLNAAGALLIILSLTFKFNLSAFIVEVFWLLISLFGLMKSLLSRGDAPRSSRRD